MSARNRRSPQTEMARRMTQRRSKRTVGTVLGTILFLAACGGGDAPATDAAAADTATPVAPPPPPEQPGERGYPTERTGGVAGVLGNEGDTERVALTVKDGSLKLSQDSIGGGPTTLVIENQGEQRHIIEVFSEHYGRWRSAPIGPGGSASISMPLTYATYEVRCTVEGHRENGEVATLRVQ